MDNFTKRITRIYWKELGAALVLYTVVIFAVMPRVDSIETLWLRAVFALSPMLPILLVTVAIVRHILRMDELQRARAFEVIALSAGATAILSLAYGFLEIAGFPRRSMFAVWIAMGTFWLAINQIYRFFGRHHP